MMAVRDFLGSLDWDNWFYGLIAAIIGGGSGAVSAGITVSAIDPQNFSFGGAKSFKLMGVVFAVNGCVGMFSYLRTAPLPKILTTTTVETVAHPTPSVTVTKTVQETQVTAPQVKNGDAKP